MIQVGILGHGIVGSGAVQVLIDNAEHIGAQAGDRIAVKRILDLRTFADAAYADRFTDRFEDILDDPDIAIVVECMGGVDPAYDYVRRALEGGKHVVTSNKELVVTHGEELTAIAQRGSINFLYEASVAGGIPVIRPLRQCMAANRIERIEGILNGTTNYILTRMAEVGLTFPAALAEAQREGYAERDPSADVQGLDARRKLAILAHVAFGARLDDSRIPASGIERVSREDLQYAQAIGRTVKLIGAARLVPGGYTARVAPAMVDARHPLSSVRDVFNAVFVHGNMVDDVMFYGRGAGKLPTASAIVADVIDVAKHLERPKWEPAFPEIAFVPDEEPCRAFARASFQSRQTALDGVAAVFPGSELIWMDGEAFHGEFGFLTRPTKPDALDTGIRTLGERMGLRVSTPIRVLDAAG